MIFVGIFERGKEEARGIEKKVGRGLKKERREGDR